MSDDDSRYLSSLKDVFDESLDVALFRSSDEGSVVATRPGVIRSKPIDKEDKDKVHCNSVFSGAPSNK